MFLLFGYNRLDDFKGGINDLITQADTLEELKEFIEKDDEDASFTSICTKNLECVYAYEPATKIIYFYTDNEFDTGYIIINKNNLEQCQELERRKKEYEFLRRI